MASTRDYCGYVKALVFPYFGAITRGGHHFVYSVAISSILIISGLHSASFSPQAVSGQAGQDGVQDQEFGVHFRFIVACSCLLSLLPKQTLMSFFLLLHDLSPSRFKAEIQARKLGTLRPQGLIPSLLNPLRV